MENIGTQNQITKFIHRNKRYHMTIRRQRSTEYHWTTETLDNKNATNCTNLTIKEGIETTNQTGMCFIQQKTRPLSCRLLYDQTEMTQIDRFWAT